MIQSHERLLSTAAKVVNERAEAANRVKAQTQKSKRVRAKRRHRPADMPSGREIVRAALMVTVGISIDGGMALAAVSPFIAIPLAFAAVVATHFVLRSWVEAS